MSVGTAERKATLEIFNHIGSNPVIFDVGSNKGEWLDILVGQAKECHLFEPNTLLRHYTQVKYIGHDHIKFNEEAVSDKSGEDFFYYFTNENNGLSSLLNNPKWDYLPKQKMVVNKTTIDEYCRKNKIDGIDLLKIDVEGAEWQVVVGAMRMLKRHQIRFIQIEYSEHYQLSGRTFKDLIEKLNTLDYKAYSFDGEKFVLQTSESFVEDYRLENFYFTAMDITQDWNGEFKRNTKDIPKFNFALEIGCFEGLTTRYICDNLLNPGGRIICVDPLIDGEYLPNHPDNHLFKGQYERFVKNTHGYPVELIRKTSRETFYDLKDYRFDFIYVDGDHTFKEVRNDGIQCFKILKPGGYILFDDYEYREETKAGIDSVIAAYGNFAKVIHKGYQVLLQKVTE